MPPVIYNLYLLYDLVNASSETCRERRVLSPERYLHLTFFVIYLLLGGDSLCILF